MKELFLKLLVFLSLVVGSTSSFGETGGRDGDDYGSGGGRKELPLDDGDEQQEDEDSASE